MFGLFDPPQLKAHRKAAQAARTMRELAGRELALELRMLANRLHWANEQCYIAYADDKTELAQRLSLTILDGQDIIDRVGRSTDAIMQEVSDNWSSAVSAAQFEAVASFEIDLRTTLVTIRDEARSQLTIIGMAAMDASGRHASS